MIRIRHTGHRVPPTCGRPKAPAGPAAVIMLMCLVVAPPGAAHDEELRTPIVIDTDMGLDDVIALAMALQSPSLDVAAVMAGEGVAAPSAANEFLGRLLYYFNRPDVRFYEAAVGPVQPAPACRQRAAAFVDGVLPTTHSMTGRPHTPLAYRVDGHLSTVVVLGPLTQLSAALASAPEIKSDITRIVVAGDPESKLGWNLARDPGATATILGAGIPVVFVRAGERAGKPAGWFGAEFPNGRATSLGAVLIERLAAAPEARDHYSKILDTFHDELAVLYLVHPEFFAEVDTGIVEPVNNRVVATAIAAVLNRGRQRKDRVVFTDGPLPEGVLRPDVRARRDAIQAANGPDEWFAQLLLNELHEHLGAYSIIGAKMGLRASELLNAPQHAMAVVSAAPPTPPVSCLNDGLLVATGSTPGRGLFSHIPGPAGSVEASFRYNGRTITLRLKDEYRARIRTTIQDLLARFTLEDEGYWEGVRDFGLDIWQNWHRRDLFREPAIDRRIIDSPSGGPQ